jgi:hypothetical protein
MNIKTLASIGRFKDIVMILMYNLVIFYKKGLNLIQNIFFNIDKGAK